MMMMMCQVPLDALFTVANKLVKQVVVTTMMTMKLSMMAMMMMIVKCIC